MKSVNTTSRVAAFFWALVVAILLVAAWQKGPIVDTSMMSLLPASEQQPLVKEASLQMGKQFSQRVLIIASGADKTAVRKSVKTLAHQFSNLPVVASVLWQVKPEAMHLSSEALKPYRYGLLSAHLKKQLASGDSEGVRKQALAQLINPVSIGPTDLRTDPFYLLPQWQLTQTPVFNFAIEDGLLRISDTNDASYLVLLQFNQDSFQRKTQQLVLNQLALLQAQFEPKGIKFTPSGLLVHADAGAKQAEREMSTIGLGSMAGILIMMLLVFRSVRYVIYLFTPVLVGCLVAVASVFLLFDRVHIVTFAFGAGLIGVSIDYALHYLCERHFRVDVIKHLLPSLLLGLCTSVVAYAAQAVTPFPGLRQMALFSVFGLIGAWLTVVLWLPIMTGNASFKPIRCLPKIKSLLQTLPSIDTHRWITPLLVMFGLVAIGMIQSGSAVDDIRLLQTSPPHLMAQEAAVQKKLKLNSVAQFLLMPCRELQQCLETEEAMKPVLNSLVDKGVLTSVDLLSDKLPSLAQQNHNVNLIQHLYEKELGTLFTNINMPTTALDAALHSFDADKENRLTVDTLPNTMFFQHLRAKVVTTESAGLATVIGLKSTSLDRFKVEYGALKTQFPSVVLVDQVETISNLMGNYRHQVMLWVGLAYAFIFGCCWLRYQSHAIRVITPPLLASLLTAAILMHSSTGINIFHLLALILVLGIGMDMGIFLTETKQAAQTWLAVSLSIITSILAFGLLFMSQTPVLSHFGVTVLLGLIFVWVFSVLLRPVKI